VNPDDKKEKTYAFDFSYSPESQQSQLWTDIGVGILDNAYKGFNCSLFAYGQTGSGKSFSMMGYGEDKGIIPIMCERIFDRVTANTDPDLTM